MIDPNLAGMVIDFLAARHRIRQKRAAQWLRTYTRPFPGDAA